MIVALCTWLLFTLKMIWDKFHWKWVAAHDIVTHLLGLKIIRDIYQWICPYTHCLVAHLIGLKIIWSLYYKEQDIFMWNTFLHLYYIYLLYYYIYIFYHFTFFIFIYIFRQDDVKIYSRVVILYQIVKNDYLLLPQFFCLFFLVFWLAAILPSWWMPGS